MDNNFSKLEWVKEALGIQDFISVEKIRSAEQNNVIKIETNKGSYILKQGPSLTGEKERLVWLDGRLPVPKVIAWKSNNDQDELLTTYVEGEDLALLSSKIPKEELVNLLADTLHLIHSVDVSDCPFGERSKDSVFIHGDACLPNFIFSDGKVSGIIDLGDAGIGDKTDDLAAAVWSLDFNQRSELGIPFLETYGISSPSNEDVERLKNRYEANWAERFEEPDLTEGGSSFMPR